MGEVDQRIKTELEALGYTPSVLEGETAGGRQRVVTFEYGVPTGRFKGRTYMVGISTQCEAVGYPEVPPHWIFVSPPISDTRDGGNHGTTTLGGRQWIAMSRPPGAFWDRIGEKGMKAYLEHLAKVWKHI